ncbi:NAD dehydrogenase [Coprinopsis sp. MPI-PUGE-AT-0042]|nr:NAD dehydrogenase [Coprinopsis sp. MPI-PUGE-AT-0042]
MQAIRGLKRALNDTGRWRYKAPEVVVDHVVVGGGIVGLAIAQRLCKDFPNKSTYLIERHKQVGEEISSRNSEVIHSGLYYPPNSLKTQLCLRGRDLLYDYCTSHSIPHKRTGKLVVATKPSHIPYLESLHHKASHLLSWPPHLLQANPSLQDTPVLPTEMLNGEQARKMEPDLSPGVLGALWVPGSGIVDSHTLMQSLETEVRESDGGEVVCGTSVARIDPYIRSKRPVSNVEGAEGVESGWVVQVVTSPEGSSAEEPQTDAILAKTLINAAGLSSTYVLNSILPPSERIPMYFAKGSYAKYKGPGVGGVKHLIYPCPDTASPSPKEKEDKKGTETQKPTKAVQGKNPHAFQSLGTHLTLDLDGNIRFGPDLEWINAPLSGTDFWTKHLVPDDSRIPSMHEAIKDYLPDVSLDGLSPDYVGIRPKLVAPPHEGFQDFVFRVDYPTSPELASGDGEGRMVSLLGVESPGLTSSLAIAEHVVGRVLKNGTGNGAAKGTSGEKEST